MATEVPLRKASWSASRWEKFPWVPVANNFPRLYLEHDFDVQGGSWQHCFSPYFLHVSRIEAILGWKHLTLYLEYVLRINVCNLLQFFRNRLEFFSIFYVHLIPHLILSVFVSIVITNLALVFNNFYWLFLASNSRNNAASNWVGSNKYKPCQLVFLGNFQIGKLW